MKSILRPLRYSFRYVKTQFIQEKFFNISSIIILSLVCLLLNTFFALYFLALSSLNSVHERIDLFIYLNPSAQEKLSTKLLDTIKKQSFVREAQLINGKDSLKALLDFEEKSQLEALENWIELPPYIRVKTEEIQDQKRLLTLIEKEGYTGLLNKEQNIKESEIIAQKLYEIQHLFSRLSSLVFFVLILCTLGIMVFSLHDKLQGRKKEHHIMQLVGADENMQKFPIFIEAILIQNIQFIITSLASLALGFWIQQSTGLLIPANFWIGIFIGEFFFFNGLAILSASFVLYIMKHDRK